MEEMTLDQQKAIAMASARQRASEASSAPAAGNATIMAAHPVPHTGYAAQVRQMAAQGPDKVAAKPWSELGQNWKDVGIGTAEGVPAGVAGAPGDIESMGRLLLSPLGVSRENFLPTSSQAGDLLFGEAANQYQAGGRVIGNQLAPVVTSKAIDLVGRGMSAGMRTMTRGMNADVAGPELAGRALNEMAGPNVNFDQAPLPGMQLTAAQSSNNPGLAWAERSLQRSDPEVMAATASARTQNNQAITNAINSLGDTSSTDASARMASRIEVASKSAKTATRAAWKAAGIDENVTKIPVADLKTSIGQYVGGLTKADQEAIPSSIASILDKFGDAEPLREIQGLRSRVGGMAAQAARAGDGNTARIIGGIADHIAEYTDEMLDPALSAMGGSPGELAKYDAARSATRQMKETFSQPKVIRAVLGSDSYGADRVPVSAVADKIISSGQGGPEVLNDFLKAVGTDPEARQAARDAFAQKFLDAAQTTIPDQNGNRIVSAANIARFVDKYQHVIDSPLYSAAERRTFSNIQRAADMAARTVRGTPPGGSDTMANLAGKQFLDAILGRAGSTVAKGIQSAPAAVGGGIGAVVAGPSGAAAGAAIGQNLGSGLLERLYGPTRDNALMQLRRAITDPVTAQRLMAGTPAQANRLATFQRSLMIDPKMLTLSGAQAMARLSAPEEPAYAAQ